jgi:hypothetical protein
MATACLFIGWNRPYPEHHKEAYSYLTREGRERLQTWKKEGWFETSEVFGLTAHGGDLNGCIIIKGERAKLDELRRTDDFERFSMTMSKNFDRYGVVPGVTEEGMKKVMERNPDLVK